MTADIIPFPLSAGRRIRLATDMTQRLAVVTMLMPFFMASITASWLFSQMMPITPPPR